MTLDQNEKIFRYPGTRPFSAGQSDIFFGRENDIRDFYRLMNVENLVVLYSKSGMGKSSLLNAGILPRVHQEGRFIPVVIRFGAYVEGKKESPLEICRQFIVQEAEKNQVLQKILPDDNTIWTALKQRCVQMEKNKGFLLIFDQFEELFTYPKEAVEAFKAEFSEAINTDIPHNIRQELGAKLEQDSGFISDEELEWLHTPFQTKVVMAIRSDRMSLMTQMADYLPNILSNCYELGPLSPEQAEDAILNPAFKNDQSFASPPFDYKDDVIESIMNFLTEDNTESIESFQLQIICQFIERKVIEKQLKTVELEDIGQIEGIIKNYYNDQIALLGSESDQYLARILIEDGLIFEEEERRLSMYEGQIYKSYGLSPELLRKLVDTHLLRAEPSVKGGYTYELSHDTLVAPILRSRQVRKDEEARQAALRAQLEKDQEMEALREQAIEDRAKRRQYRMFAILGFLLFFLALGASFLAVKQSRLAEQKKLEAEHSLSLLETAQKEKIMASYNEYLARGKSFMEQSKYFNAIQEFNTALAFNAKGEEALLLLEESRQKDKVKLTFEQYIAKGDSLYSSGPGTYMEALEKYRMAEKLQYDDKLSRQKINFMSGPLNVAFVQFVREGDIFYKAEGYKHALRKFQQAQQIQPQNSQVEQKIAACKKNL